MEANSVKYKGEISLYAGANKFEVQADPDAIIKFKMLFPKVNAGERRPMLTVTDESCYDLEWFMMRYPLRADEETLKVIKQGSLNHQNLLLKVKDLLLPDYKPAKEYKMEKPPRLYQMQSDELYDLKTFLLNGDDLGLGKTVTAICSFTDIKKLPALVVCESHLRRQWYQKIKEFIPTMAVHIIGKSQPYRLPPCDVFICSYSMLYKWVDVFMPFIKSVVYDECQNIRVTGSYYNPSKKYTAAKNLNKEVPYRLGLSATPIYNYGDEIFNVMDCLSEGCLGTKVEFLREWCVQRGQKYMVENPQALGMFLRDSGMMIRRTEKDVEFQLPKEQQIIHMIPYDTKVLEKIKSDATELAKLILQGKFGESGEAARQFDLKLRQQTGIAKAPYVANFVKMLLENYDNCLLFAWHREVYDIYMEQLKDFNPVMYTGSESEKQKDRSKQMFMNRDSRVMIISLRSGAGMDGLQEHSNVEVFGELDWSPLVHRQCIGRLRRPGQNRSVQVFYLVSDGGSDPTVCNTLGLKLNQSEGIMNLNDKDSIFEMSEDNTSRIKELARNYLKSA